MAGCPFCGEPAVRTMVGGIVAYRCGTEGPYVSDDGHAEYQTGRVCDMHTYQRMLAKQQSEIELLRRQCDQLSELVDVDRAETQRLTRERDEWRGPCNYWRRKYGEAQDELVDLAARAAGGE